MNTAHLATLAGHVSRLKQQIGWEMSPHEGVALMIALAVLAIIFGPRLLRGLAS